MVDLHSFVIGVGQLPKGRFTLGSKIKKTSKSNNPIGLEQTFGPKEFTLGYGSKYEINKVTSLCHHHPAKSR